MHKDHHNMSGFNLQKDRVAILAGGGLLPIEILAAMSNDAPKPMIIGIAGEIDDNLTNTADAVLTFGQVGKLFDLLEKNNIRHVTLAGSVDHRPDFKTLKLDFRTIKELPKLLKISMGGDNSVLEKVAEFFASHQIEVIAAHHLAPELLAPQGLLAGKKPNAKQMKNVELAFEAAKTIGALDAGQAVVAEEGRIIALEGAEGTDAVLARVAELRQKGRIARSGKTGILAKVMKPEQDDRADLPTIGPDTIDNAKSAGLVGIVVEAQCSLILSRVEAFKRAQKAGLFIFGIETQDETK